MEDEQRRSCSREELDLIIHDAEGRYRLNDLIREDERQHDEIPSLLEAIITGLLISKSSQSDSRLIKIVGGYVAFQISPFPTTDEIAREMINSLNINPTPDQILKFSRAMARAGYNALKGFEYGLPRYINALINSSSEREFELDFRGFEYYRFDEIGCKLTNKKLVIYGNVGELVGYLACNSEITVKGDAGRCAGSEMSSSKLTIEGSTRDVGFDAINSEIYLGGEGELSFNIGSHTVGYRKNDAGDYVQIYPKVKR